MDLEDEGTSVYCILSFISISFILLILFDLSLNLNPPSGTSIQIGNIINDIIMIIIVLAVIAVIVYMYLRSKKNI
jgi:hypothetical protein